MKMLLRIALVLVTMAVYAAEINKLESLRSTCSTAMDKIATDTQQQKDAALAQYGKKIGSILQDLKKRGDLDGYTVVEKELERFRSDQTILTSAANVNVSNAAAAYQKQMTAIEIDAESRTVNLLRQYIAALGQLIKDLMVQDKISDAKAVGEVKRNAEFALVDAEAKVPKCEQKNVKPVSPDNRVWKDITSECVGGKKSFGGVVLKKERMQSKALYRPPIEIEYVCKPDSQDIRLVYACDQMIFNWECKQSELRLDGGPANGQHHSGVGSVLGNQFVTFRQIVLQDKMEVYVDDVLRATWQGDFSKVNSLIGVAGLTTTVKSIRIRVPLDDALVKVPERIGSDATTLPEAPQGGRFAPNDVLDLANSSIKYDGATVADMLNNYEFNKHLLIKNTKVVMRDGAAPVYSVVADEDGKRRESVLLMHPKGRSTPAILDLSAVLKGRDAIISIMNMPGGDCRTVITADNNTVIDTIVTGGRWTDYQIKKPVEKVLVENHANGWIREFLLISVRLGK